MNHAFICMTDKSGSESRLPAATEIAGIGIVQGAGRGRHRAGLGGGDGGLGRCGRDLGGGSGTGEGEDDDEGADDVFHDEIPQKLYSRSADFAGQIR